MVQVWVLPLPANVVDMPMVLLLAFVDPTSFGFLPLMSIYHIGFGPVELLLAVGFCRNGWDAYAYCQREQSGAVVPDADPRPSRFGLRRVTCIANCWGRSVTWASIAPAVTLAGAVDTAIQLFASRLGLREGGVILLLGRSGRAGCGFTITARPAAGWARGGGGRWSRPAHHSNDTPSCMSAGVLYSCVGIPAALHCMLLWLPMWPSLSVHSLASGCCGLLLMLLSVLLPRMLRLISRVSGRSLQVALPRGRLLRRHAHPQRDHRRLFSY